MAEYSLGLDIGGADALDRYASWRRVDTLALLAVTDGLNRLFSNDVGPLRLVRDLGLESARTPDLASWAALVARIKRPKTTLEVALVGKYIELPDAYLSVTEALRHAAWANGVDAKVRWVNSETLTSETVEEALDGYAPHERDDVLLMFSAHSLPLSVIERGDAYPQEVGATVQLVLEALGRPNPSLLAYQSEVGPVRWLGPSTEQVIRALAARKRHNVLAIPIAFTSDHIETLSEIDREYGELAHSLGLRGFRRSASLNARPRFLDAMADLVHGHMVGASLHSTRYAERCPGCVNPMCRQTAELRAVEAVTPASSAVARARSTRARGRRSCW